MKSHVHRFPVTIDALVGAGLLPILGWCRHNDSHFLRTLGTKQHPGVSRDCLVRHMIMHRHDDSPFVGKRLGCRPSRVCIKLLTGLARSKGLRFLCDKEFLLFSLSHGGCRKIRKTTPHTRYHCTANLLHFWISVVLQVCPLSEQSEPVAKRPARDRTPWLG
jgi:hypothetical protein